MALSFESIQTKTAPLVIIASFQLVLDRDAAGTSRHTNLAAVAASQNEWILELHETTLYGKHAESSKDQKCNVLVKNNSPNSAINTEELNSLSWVVVRSVV